jgi:hypothetical protein
METFQKPISSQLICCSLDVASEVNKCTQVYENTVELGYNVTNGTEYFVSL